MLHPSDEEKLAEFATMTTLSEDTREDLYTMGYHFYQHRKYGEAAGCFSLLVLAESKISKYWIGLAAAQQMSKKYDEAMTSYAFASQLDEQNPRPYFHLAECFFALQKSEEGLKALDRAEEMVEAKQEYEELRSRISVMRERWIIKLSNNKE